MSGKKLREAERHVDRLRRALLRASAAYLRLVDPTAEEVSVVGQDLWDNLEEDLDSSDLPHWNALLAEQILDERAHPFLLRSKPR